MSVRDHIAFDKFELLSEITGLSKKIQIQACSLQRFFFEIKEETIANYWMLKPPGSDGSATPT